jgi:GNAT superfamily N-acetyltransferase
MIKIKKINIEFIGEIYNLCKIDFGKDFWFTKKFIQETLKTPGYYYGGFDRKKLIGIILVRKFDRPKFWIFLFLVAKNYRKKGIGTRLLKVIERKCTKDYPLIFVDFSQTDKNAQQFYLKNGFEKKAKINDWFGVGEAGLVYAKRIIY